MQKSCKKCKFFEPLTVNPQRGYCHRYPPTPDGKNINSIDNFPVLRETGYCGEFQKKVAKSKRK